MLKRLQIWKKALARREFGVEILVTLFAFFLLMHGYTRYLDVNELRAGVQLADPILRSFEALDMTWAIFLVIHLSVLIASWETVKYPKRFIKGIQVYTLVMSCRWLTLFLVPLEAPAGIISLRDPFVMSILASGRVLDKDLFFSGHTATMMMLCLMVERGWLKKALVAATVFVAASILLQKVHYTVDVFVAPFITYGCYRLVFLFDSWMIQKNRFSA